MTIFLETDYVINCIITYSSLILFLYYFATEYKITLHNFLRYPGSETTICFKNW